MSRKDGCRKEFFRDLSKGIFWGSRGGLEGVQGVGSKGGFEGWVRRREFMCALGEDVGVNAATEWFQKVSRFKGEPAAWVGLKGDLEGQVASID